VSAQGNSFLYWLVNRMSQGATPVDGLPWVDPRSARGAPQERVSRPVESPFHLHANCDDCPSPIF
jgi:hypothetical protein